MKKHYLIIEDPFEISWMLVLYDDTTGDHEVLFTSETEDECYEYLEKNIHPEGEVLADEVSKMIDEHKLRKYLSKSKNSMILYCHHSDFLDNKIMVRLRDAWEWGEGAQSYVDRFNKKLVLVSSISEMRKVVKYIQKK